jgi:PAS domain-containing protein
VSRAYENPVLSRTGRTRTLLWNASLLRNGDGRPLAIIGIGQDITPLKAAQEELFQSEAELRALLENSPDIIARVDPSLRYAYVNRAITGEFGHTLRAACELGFASGSCAGVGSKVPRGLQFPAGTTARIHVEIQRWGAAVRDAHRA